MTPWTVVVADSMSMSRLGVVSLLESDGRFRSVECSSSDALEAAATTLGPPVALVDAGLPPTGGLRAVARVATVSDCRLILWETPVIPQRALAALAAGASGILPKDISEPGLLRALAAACRGEALLGREVATWVVDAVRAAALDPAHRRSPGVDRLSGRERQVLRLVALGYQNREIAEVLTVSEYTVKRHVQNILGKLAHPSREVAAAAYLSQIGLDATGSDPAQERPTNGAVQSGLDG